MSITSGSVIFMGSLTCKEIQLQQFWRNPLFGNYCSGTECDIERKNVDVFVFFTIESGQTL